MDAGSAGGLMLVGNQVKKQAEGLSAREHFGHSLKIVVFTHLSPPRSQELCLGLDTWRVISRCIS